MMQQALSLKSLPMRLLIILGLWGLLFLGGCSNESPEDQVRLFIKTAEDAVENNEIGDVREMISESYSDDKGRTKKDIIRYLSYQLLRKRSIHLFTSIDTITIVSENQAKVNLFVAMTGQPVESASILPQLHADIYRFDLNLQKEDGDWLLVTSMWQPAIIDDIFTE